MPPAPLHRPPADPPDAHAGPGRRVRRGPWRLLAAGLLIAGLSVGYVEVVRPTIVPKNFGVVEEGRVYRSGWLTPAATERVVKAHGIRTIIDLGAYDKDPAGEVGAERTAAALGVERRVFRLEGDGTGNPNAYVEALRIVTDPSKQPVLVHCSAGSERTGACVLLYREIVQGKAVESQLHETYEHGHDPSRNVKMAPYLREWKGPITEAFRSGGLIPGQGPAEIVSPARP